MHRILRYLRRNLLLSLRCEAGGILPMFALSLMVMFGTIAAAVDFGLAYSHRDKLQKAADSAALAAAILLDASEYERKLTAMVPYLWTHIAAGAEIGWQMISPNGEFGGANPYDPEKTIKVAIILTDGMQTAPGCGPDSTQTTLHAENNLSALREGMKAQQIKVYAIGYDLADDHTKTLLADCSGPGRFYNADDIQSGLLTAFVDIGEKVREQMVRLSD